MKIKLLFCASIGLVIAGYSYLSNCGSIASQSNRIGNDHVNKPVVEGKNDQVLDFNNVDELIAISEQKVTELEPGVFHMVDRGEQLRATITTQKYRLEDQLDPSNWYVDFGVPNVSKGGTMRRLLSSEVKPSINGKKLNFTSGNDRIEFINENSGIRQNFIVGNRPDGSKDLELIIPISGSLSLEVNTPTSITFSNSNSHTSQKVLKQNDLKVWDADGNTLNAWFQLKPATGATSIDHLAIVVQDQNANYPITVDPLSTTVNRLLVGPQVGAEYGYSVSTAGDVNGDGYSDILVGAPEYDNGQNNEGVVFVHYGSSNGITATPDLVLEVDQGGGRFGSSVATAGDVNGDGYSDVIVGARNWESSAAELTEGAAFIFHGSAVGLDPVYAARLEPNHAGDIFGSFVNTAGDLNGDGFSDIVVGGYLASYSGSGGVAFVHLGSAAGINIAAAHRLRPNQTNAHFGIGVSSAGDVNGDGYSDLIVGASRYDVSNSNDGAAFLWLGSAASLGGFNPAPDQVLAPHSEVNGNYGWGVSSAGDVNGDGYSDVIVGAYRAGIGQSEEGMAFIHLGSALGVDPVPTTILQSNQASAWFGRSVSNAGDVNGDGYGDVMVGAPGYTLGQTDEGAIFVYPGSPSGTLPTYIGRLQANASGSNLGNSARCAGDVNGDGYSDIIGGAHIYGSGGAAFIYYGGGYSVATTFSQDLPSSIPLEEKGKSVAHAGDVNGDGFADVIVGIPNYSNGQSNEGGAEVYYGSSSGIAALPNITLESNSTSALFGSSVCSAGDVNGDGYADVIIGAPGYTNGQANEGAAYIYLGAPAGLSGTPFVIIQGGQANASFGHAVSKAGDINSDGYSDVVVGAPNFNGANNGVAMLFLGSSTGTVNAPNPIFTAPQANSGFGISVNTAGDVNGDGYSDVIIGAPYYDNGQVDEGAGFVYYGSEPGMNAVPSVTIERNYAGAELGTSVSTAGDANGDGFWDVIMGAPKWSNNVATPNEGTAFVWYGTAAGFTPANPGPIQRNQANAEVGTWVSDAGDLNGDGYADVLLGAPFWENSGQTDEGAVFLYHGRAAGVNTGAMSAYLQSNLAGSYFGASAQTAGDVNGDGYSDVIVGAPDYNGMGTAQVFHGNQDGNIFRYTRQYQADLVNPLAVNSMDYTNPGYFGIGHYARSFTMRQSVLIEWEVVHEGEAFSGNPISNSVSSTGATTIPVDLGLNGVEIKQQIFKLPPFIRHKWRVRVKYDPVRMIDGQPYSRWFYGFAAGFGDIGVLPVEFTYFNGQHEDGNNHLSWTTATETNNSHFNIERSPNGAEFSNIGEIAGAGNSQSSLNYTFVDHNAPTGTNFYRLEQVDYNGETSFSDIISITTGIGIADLALYPNPVKEDLNVSFMNDAAGQFTFRIINTKGQVLETIQQALPAGQMKLQFNTGKYPSGSYVLEVRSGKVKVASNTFIKR